MDEQWTSSKGTTKTLDISKMIQYLTMDIITHLLFGAPFGFLRTQSDLHDFLKIVRERLPIVEAFSVLTELCTLLKVISYVPGIKLLIPNPRDRSGIGRVMKVNPQSPYGVLLKAHFPRLRKTSWKNGCQIFQGLVMIFLDLSFGTGSLERKWNQKLRFPCKKLGLIGDDWLVCMLIFS